MVIFGKISPEIYKYLRTSGESNILQLQSSKVPHSNGLRLSADTFQSLKYTPKEITEAYREYAVSPYVNTYLREHAPLSEKSNKLVSCIKQAINESEPISGKFYRGLSNCKDEEAVRNFILKNKGFTSVTPEINKNYAESFAIGKNCAVVEFDIKTPIKGFRGNNYEVLFDTNVFTPDKYDLVKVNDNYFKLIEKTNVGKTNFAQITSHFDNGGTYHLGYIPDDYVQKTRELVEEYSYIPRFGKDKGKLKTVPAHWEERQTMLPHYHIDKLWTGGKGSGTQAVQDVVIKSLSDTQTKGRVTLDACCIDGKTSPAGFYYKLGFRFGDAQKNKELKNWLEKGGTRENAPFLTGTMFLPKENINHCLNYGKNK